MKISSKGWVVIPAELREKYGLEPGDEIRVIDYGSVLSLVPVPRIQSSTRQACWAEKGA